MKKKIWLLFLFILFVLSFFLTLIYFSKVKYFEPLSISITGLSDSEFEKINVLAETPLGKKMYLQKNITEKSFSTNGAGIFFRNIFMSLPVKKDSNTFKISIKHGKDEIAFSSCVMKNYLEINDLISNTDIKKYKLKYFFSATIFQKIKSVSLWRREVKKEVFTLIFVFLFLIVVTSLLSFYFSIIRNKVLKWVTFKGNNQRINSLLFAAFLVGNIFLLRYFIELIQERAFNQSTCLIFYILILNTLLILTFIFEKVFRKPELFFNLRISFVVLMIMLSIIEITLRRLKINATYFENTYGESNTGIYSNSINSRRVLTFKPDSELRHRYKEFEYYRKIYSEGFTQSLPSQCKKKNEVRILALGDSFTEGVGSPFDSTWVELLKGKLNKADKERFYEVFNAGVSGSDPVLEYVLLTEVLQSFSPDLVIVMVNESDINDFIVRGGFERIAKNDSLVLCKKGPWWEWAFNISFVTRLIVINGFSYNQLLIRESDMKTETAIAIEKINFTLNRFKDYTSNKKMQFLTVFLPSPHELEDGGNYQFEKLIKNLEKNNVYTLNMYEKFSAIISSKPELLNTYYWKIDGHCRPAGYNFIAEKIQSYIIGNEILKSISN